MGDWRGFLREGVSEEDESLEVHVSTGRPWADQALVERLERSLDRKLTRGQGGRLKGVPRAKGRSRQRSN